LNQVFSIHTYMLSGSMGPVSPIYLQVSSSVRGLKLTSLESCCYLGQTWSRYQ